MAVSVKSRLGVMMFLQYFIWGAWYVTLGTWLSATLPHTPPLAQAGAFGAGQVLPLEALRLLRRPSLAIFAAAKMTGGQMSELFCMLLIPWFFTRLGVKGMLAVGMAAWTLRYVLFAYGNAGALVWMLWGGILIHGICYDFFFVVGQIYIDREAPQALRAAAQGMMTLITYGAGMLMGAWLSGSVVDAHTAANAGIGGGASHDWRAIWLFAAAAAGGVLILFLAVFSDDKREPA